MPNYYKRQVEIAREFGVSEGTVTNWIKGSEEGKNNLQLIEVEDKKKILKSEHNRVEMLKLVNSGKKFRPDDEATELEVSEELYSILSENQIFSLINSLRSRDEIPYKYTFMGGGGDFWTEFYSTSFNNTNYTATSSDTYLLKLLLQYIEDGISGYDHVNIIDVGSGTGQPVLDLLHHLDTIDKLKNYVAVDISKNLIEVARQNIVKKENKFKFHSHVIDAEVNSLQDVLYRYKERVGFKKISNIILLLGGFNISSVDNEVRVLQNIKDGMDSDDFLVVSNALDSVTNRTLFPAFELETGNKQARYIASLLGITENICERELRFNESDLTREYNIISNSNININFKKYNTFVRVNKGQRINLWRHRRDSFSTISDKVLKSKLDLQFITKHPTENHVMYMCKTA